MTLPGDAGSASEIVNSTSPAPTADVSSSDQPATIAIDIPTAQAIGQALVSDTDPHSVFRRFGVVNAINTDSTLNVVIDGTIVPNLSRVASYRPTIGETVMLDVVGTDTYVTGAMAPSPRGFSRPIGIIEPYIGTIAPPGSLFCLGQTVSRTAYADLWAFAQAQSRVGGGGGLFGAGDGSTTFTMPDMRGRNLVGVGALAGDTYALGDIGGTAKPVIALANMPLHNHSVAVADHTAHTHTYSSTEGTAGDHNHGGSGTTNSVGDHAHGTSGYTNYLGQHGGHFPAQNTYVVPSGTTYGLAAWNDGGSSSGGHQHTVIDPTYNAGGHSHTINLGGNAGGHTHTPPGIAAGGPTTHTVTQNNMGSGTPFDVRSPYLAVNYIIWT